MGIKSRLLVVVLMVAFVVPSPAKAIDQFEQNIPCLNVIAAIAVAGISLTGIGYMIFYKPTPLTAEACAEKNAAITPGADPYCVCPGDGKAARRILRRKQCEPYETQYTMVQTELKTKLDKAAAELTKAEKAKKPVAAKVDEAKTKKVALEKLDAELKALPKVKKQTEDFNILFKFYSELSKH